MNECVICKKEIKDYDTQYINGKYYHNCCIENLQFKIDKANELLDGLLKDAYYNGEYIQYDYSTNDLLELKDILKEDK